MATQDGPFILSGQVCGLIFYSDKGKQYVRRKPTHVNQSEATRESSGDFRTANNAASMIHSAFKPMSSGVSDKGLYDRIRKTALDILYHTSPGVRGNRLLTDGNIACFTAIELNKGALFSKLTSLSPEITINPAADFSVRIPSMTPAACFNPPPNAVTAVLQFRCCVFHFDQKQSAFKQSQPLPISLTASSFPGAEFSFPMKGAENSVLIVAAAIHFLHKEGYKIGDHQHLAGKFLKAVTIADGQIITWHAPSSLPVAVTAAKLPDNSLPWHVNS
ncbi:hypothetical protein [Filimonas effusa]|uniref:Uncharacterized protein n=1 Tax=Filimonas effusa TaxID=2508721 RepID=A0A4V1M9W7_9BACT|nr:hypothetical protein [Filimonas effusa]RXK83114.1 hypothetical protein ESB13_13405 [Filimonas effusa]